MKLKKVEKDKRIKIAHLIARMGTGGAEEETYHTICGLDRNKYEIDLIVGEEFSKYYEKRLQEKMIHVIRIPQFFGSLHVYHDLILFIRFIFLFFKNKYIIVHTHATKAGIIGRISAKITGVPIIIQGLHGNALNAFSSRLPNRLILFLERMISHFTDSHISGSDLISQNYLDNKIGSPEKYYTVRSGMDLSNYLKKDKLKKDIEEIKKEFNINKDDFVLGNISRLEPSKGHNFLFKAAKILTERHKDKRIVLLVIGAGKEKLKLIKDIRKMGMQDNIVLTGFRKDILSLLSIMDLFVFTSLREGLPRVLVQAAAVGLPLIAFKVDGIPEIVRDGYNGFLIKPKNIAQLVDRIENYLKNPELIAVHACNSKNMVKGRWTIDGMVRETEKIYHKLLKENGIL